MPEVEAFIALSMLLIAFVIASILSAFISFGLSSIVVSITLHCAYVSYSIASFAAMTFFLARDGTAFPSPEGEGEGARGLLPHSIILDIYCAR